jgi:iron complex outermembrane recepter protein
MPPDGDTIIPGVPNYVAVDFPDPNDLLRYFPPGRNSQTFTDFSPRVGLEFRPSDSSMIYGSYAQGFKTGSWTTRLSNPLHEAPSFNPEEATTYELGWKSELMDRRLRLNAAAFYSEYDGIQLNFQEGVSPTIRNAGDAEIKGLEIEMRVALSDNFSLDAGIGYTDAKYTSVNPLVVGVSTSSRLPKTPETQVNISPQFQVPLQGGASLLFNLDYFYVSDLYNDTENTPILHRDNTSVVNGSVTYKASDEKWDIVLGGTNLTDERFLVTGQAQVAGGQIYGTYNRPVEWYLTFRVRN